MPVKVKTEQEQQEAVKNKLREQIKKYQKEIMKLQKRIQLLRRRSDECAEKITHIEFPSLFQ